MQLESETLVGYHRWSCVAGCLERRNERKHPLNSGLLSAAHPQERQPNPTSVYRQNLGDSSLEYVPLDSWGNEQRVRIAGAIFFKETWSETVTIHKNHLSSLSQLMVRNLEFPAERINGDEGIMHSPGPFRRQRVSGRPIHR
jgi:hypothetical protein